MNTIKKQSNFSLAPDAVETPSPPQHMDPSKNPLTERESLDKKRVDKMATKKE